MMKEVYSRTWFLEKKKDLENTKEVVNEFKRRMNAEVRTQKKLEMIEERDFKKEELLKKYIVKILYGWNNRKFEKEYLRNLERNW